MSEQNAEQVERDELLVLLQHTPHTDAEEEVVRRWFTGEASADDIGDVMRARLQRALDKRSNPPGSGQV